MDGDKKTTVVDGLIELDTGTLSIPDNNVPIGYPCDASYYVRIQVPLL